MNRAIFDANNAVDKAIVLPVAQAYVDVVPEFARDRVHDFLFNLNEPVTFADDILQGDVDRAAHTLGRIMINTTLGVGGLFDVAEDAGLPPFTEDFGQTLAVWGVGEGPYLVLPFFGPSNPRDTVGMVVDLFFDPLNYATYENDNLWTIMRFGFMALDVRSRNIESLNAIETTSIDYYAAIRSLYRQNRQNEIHNSAPNAEPLPQF